MTCFLLPGSRCHGGGAQTYVTRGAVPPRPYQMRYVVRATGAGGRDATADGPGQGLLRVPVREADRRGGEQATEIRAPGGQVSLACGALYIVPRRIYNAAFFRKGRHDFHIGVDIGSSPKLICCACGSTQSRFLHSLYEEINTPPPQLSITLHVMLSRNKH